MKKKTKAKQGRPVTLPAELDDRFQIRCNSADPDAWKAHAAALGFRDASSWIRHALKIAMKQPTK